MGTLPQNYLRLDESNTLLHLSLQKHCTRLYESKMNILREVTKGGKGKLLESLRTGSQDLGTVAPLALHEPNVETNKVKCLQSSK